MNFDEFQKFFSAPRVERYLRACKRSGAQAMILYKANIKVRQAFHPLLSIVEVVIRNRINDVLTEYFQDPDWILNQKTGFMQHQELEYFDKRAGVKKRNDFLLKEVEKAERKLKRQGICQITSGKIIAEQSFGFWIDLFETYHYRILKGRPIQIFSSIPPQFGRKQIHSELGKIRVFRNRINHNEPICFDGDIPDFSFAKEVYHSITSVLQWIDSVLIDYIADIDNVLSEIEDAEQTLKNTKSG